MYSVIQPIEVLDDNDDMVSTWIVLATDLGSIDSGNAYITDNIEEDLVTTAWVVKTSDILKMNSETLRYLVLAYDDSPEDVLQRLDSRDSVNF